MVHGSRLQSLLGLSLHLLPSLLLVVLALHVLQLPSQSLDLILVLVDLGLVHVELSSHRLHLTGLLLQVLLVDGELLCNLGTRLSGKEVFELVVELLLLLDDHILLDNLLGLLDQSLLENLDLLKHLPGIGISSLKLSPSVTVKRVLKLLREGLDLESLGKQLLLEVEDLFPEVGNLLCLGFDDSELTLVVADLELEESNVLKSLLVLDFSSCEGALEDLDLFVKKGELVVSSDELGSEDVSLVDHALVVLLELLDFLVGLLNDVAKLGDLVVLLLANDLCFLELVL